MASFEPPLPPLTPDAPEPAPELDVPLPPPLVGLGSPWAPADAENRDRILDWWRMWFRRVFFPWIAAWVAYWAAQWARIIAYLNAWLNYAGEYIEDHAVNGHSWWKTDTPIAPTGTTVVEIIPYDEFRPILIGDLVSDTSTNVVYGIVTALVDDTHAEVTPLGQLRGERGLEGFGWWSTGDTIAHTGTTTVVVDAQGDRLPQVGDFVADQSETTAYGQVVALDPSDEFVVEVEYIGTLQGPPGVAALGAYDVATPSLAPFGDPGDTYQSEMPSQPQMVGAFTVSVSSRAWVRVYASEAYMLADASRDIMTPLNIADDHGCYLDYVGIPGSLFKTLTPGVQFTDLGDGLWLSVVNTNVVAEAIIDVHFDYRIFRE